MLDINIAWGEGRVCDCSVRISVSQEAFFFCSLDIHPLIFSSNPKSDMLHVKTTQQCFHCVLRITLPTAHILFNQLPLLNGRTLFSRISRASVPSSIKSNFVITPIVLTPEMNEDMFGNQRIKYY